MCNRLHIKCKILEKGNHSPTHHQIPAKSREQKRGQLV